MKNSITVAVVSTVFAIASTSANAQAQSTPPTATDATTSPAVGAPSPAQTPVVSTTTNVVTPSLAAPSGPAAQRFRFGVDLSYGVLVMYTFSNYRFTNGTIKSLNLRGGLQVNHNWSILGRVGVSPLGDANLGLMSGLVEFSPSDFFGVSFGPTLTALVPNVGDYLVAPGATFRATGYFGTIEPNRRHSFSFGFEANTSLFPGANISSFSVALGYDMR